MWGALARAGRRRTGGKLEEAAAGLRAGSRQGAISHRALGGRVRGLGGRGRQGAVRRPRGVSEL